MCGVFLDKSCVITEAQVLKASVTMVPNSFYGCWRVVSKLIETDSPVSFKEKGLDMWNLSCENNVIILSNPFSGANAQIRVESVNNNSIVFTKSGKYGNKFLTDTVNISISGDNFTGTVNLTLDTLSDVDGKIIKTETAKYSVKGERIAGQSIR